MIPDNNMEQRIWDYLDGLADAGERQYVERMVEQDPRWKAALEEIRSVQTLLGSQDLEHPSLRFVQNTMEAIARYEVAPRTRTYLNRAVVLGIAGFFILLIGGLLVYAMSQVSWASGESSGGGYLPSWDFSGLANPGLLRIFLGADIILGLWLLDSFIRKRQWSRA